MFRNIWLKTPYVNKLPVPLLQRLLGLILDSYHDNFQELLEIWLENVNITEIRNTDRNNEKNKETCALIIHGSLRGVRKFTPPILSESANVQKEQIRINLLVI